jgi:hypothetical protein
MKGADFRERPDGGSNEPRKCIAISSKDPLLERRMHHYISRYPGD